MTGSGRPSRSAASRRRRTAPLARALALAPLLLGAGGCGARSRGVEGRVMDHLTNRPVAGAAVTLSARGWGISDGELVWDKDYPVHAVSDGDGRFRVRVRGGHVRVTADAAGYVRYGGWLEDGRTELRLQPRRPRNPALRRGLLEVGMRDGVPYGWVLAEARRTTRLDSADLLAEPPREVVGAREFALRAPGGLRFVPSERFGPVDDPLVYADEAPEHGYAPVLRVRPGETGTIFVRARDGRFARLDANPGMLGSTREAAAGTIGFSFRYVYDSTGGRDLADQPPPPP